MVHGLLEATHPNNVMLSAFTELPVSPPLPSQHTPGIQLNHTLTPVHATHTTTSTSIPGLQRRGAAVGFSQRLM